jgi:hypothetical protein
MNSKQKGDIAEAKSTADLLSRGLDVARPFGDNAPFDLIAIDQTFALWKVQVKYACLNSSGAIELRLKSTFQNTRKTYTRKYTLDKVDVFAVYCPDTDCVYYVNSGEALVNERSVFLRIEEPKNGQKEGVRLAKYYTEFRPG